MESTTVDKTESSYKQTRARNVTILGALLNAIMGVAKIFFGWWGNSNALLADGVHSLSDLITDALVLFASHFSAQAADRDHPYGHGRIETAATLFLALLLAITGAGIIWDAVLHLYSKQLPSPHPWIILAAVASIIINEFLFHITKRVGKKINSNLLIANAWHHRSDALSSLIVFAGMLGALFGYLHLDAIAAAIVGLMIIKMGGGLIWDSLRELIDTAVDPAILDKINAAIVSVPGVVALHQLRTRSMSGRILIDVHIIVAPQISVSEGHHIGQQVHFSLIKQVPEIKDVTVHIDPEDDEIVPPSLHLPLRDKLLADCYQRWQSIPAVAAINRLNIHYLAGKMRLELVLDKDKLPSDISNSDQALNELQQQFAAALADMPDIDEVELLLAA